MKKNKSKTNKNNQSIIITGLVKTISEILWDAAVGELIDCLRTIEKENEAKNMKGTTLNCVPIFKSIDEDINIADVFDTLRIEFAKTAYNIEEKFGEFDLESSKIIC